MDDFLEVNQRNWDERAIIHARDATGFYRIEEFRAGLDTLNDIESGELGDVAGMKVLHLQCHIGLDTLSLARRGANVTGLDFSREALDFARRLSETTGIDATFVHGAVAEAERLAPGPFDLVFTTWGTICWLPDIRDWAKVIASVLAPGGELYFADCHPGFRLMEEQAGRPAATHDFRTPAGNPLTVCDSTTYTGDRTVMAHQKAYEWVHSLSDIIGSLLDAGLTITMFREHEVLPWKAMPCMVPARPGMWQLPSTLPRLPLAVSLRARKLRPIGGAGTVDQAR